MEAEFAVTAGAGTSDNIFLDFQDEQRETIGTVGTEFVVLQESRRLYAELNGDLTYQHYFDSDIDPEVIGSAGANLRLNVVDGLFSWSLLDRYGQTRPDLLNAATPENRENFNFISTGPNLTFRLGSEGRVVLNGRYSRIDYETDLLSTQRYSQSLSFERDFSGGGMLSLAASMQQVDPEAAPGYDQSEAVLGYSIAGARTDLLLQVGASRVEGLEGNDVGEVLRLNVSRNIGRASVLALRIGREMVDAGGSLGGWSGDGLPPATALTGDLARTVDPYTLDSVQLNWTIQGRVTSINLGGRWAMEDSPVSGAANRRRREVMFGVGRSLGPSLRAALDLRHSDQDIAGQGGTREDAAVFSLDLRLGRQLSISSSAEATRFRVRGVFDTARENRIWIRLRYGSAGT